MWVKRGCCLGVVAAGEAHSLKIEEVLFEGKSDFQDVVVFKVRTGLADALHTLGPCGIALLAFPTARATACQTSLLPSVPGGLPWQHLSACGFSLLHSAMGGDSGTLPGSLIHTSGCAGLGCRV